MQKIEPWCSTTIDPGFLFQLSYLGFYRIKFHQFLRHKDKIKCMQGQGHRTPPTSAEGKLSPIIPFQTNTQITAEYKYTGTVNYQLAHFSGTYISPWQRLSVQRLCALPAHQAAGTIPR